MQLSISKNFFSWIEKNNRLVVLFFFSAFLFVGIAAYKDYGLTWDENIQRVCNGYVNYNFIFYEGKETLLKSGDKYHGPAFELVLVLVEKALHLTEKREIYFMRHFATFFLFFISAIFFYLLSLKLFKNWKLAFIAVLFYVLSPHIFSHAFYNSKDAAFLSFFTISIYFLILFHERQTYLRAFFYALTAAFTIDIRIVAIIIPAISGLLFFMELIFTLFKKKKPEFNLKSIFLFFLMLIGFIILFWPVLWINPVHHFIAALIENSNYFYNAEVFYFGKYIRAHDLPRHYLLFWIFVSVPVIYSVLFLIGTVYQLKTFVMKPFYFIRENKNEIVILIWFFVPVSAIVIFGSVAFDTGRHLYFIHGAFILLSVYGLQSVYSFFQNKKIILYSFNFILICSLGGVIYKMVKIHPYEHLYFNEAMGNDMQKIKNNFEMDYWGISSREVLEHILEKDSSQKIVIYSRDYPVELNATILLPEQEQRIVFTDTAEQGKYYFTDYRHKPEEGEPCQKELYSVMIGNASISTAFAMRNKETLLNIEGKEIMNSKNDFEQQNNFWSSNNIIKPPQRAHSGNNVALTDSLHEFSDGYTFPVNDLLLNKKGIILKTSFWKLETMAESDAKFVISIQHKSGKSFFWRALNEIKTNEKPLNPEWEKVTGAVELPEIKENGDIISIYLWNVNKRQIFMDDVEIHFVQEMK